MKDISEEELIAHCIQGNTLAQKRLYDRYSSKLYGISLRYASSVAEAEDILQDSFIKIFNKLHTFKHEGSFEGWIKRITTHTAIEYYRRRIEYSDIEEIPTSKYTSVMEESNLEVKELLEMIQNMPTGYRLVFNLFAIEGYSHHEIASQLKITEGTSKSQLARARAYLQNKLQLKNKINLGYIQPILILIRLFS